MSKERLVYLLRKTMDKQYEERQLITPQYTADYILADGWIRPPLKIGQELWDIHYNKPRKWEVFYLGYNGKEWHINIHWWKDKHNLKTMSITYPFVGKMWYLTREEVEKELEKCGKNEIV